MAQLDGKVVLITGAARGQGASTARLCVEEGASVVVADIADDEGQALATELGEHATYVRLDVSNEDDWEAAFSAATDSHGPVTGLVNNAGISLGVGPMQDVELETYKKVVEVNQVGTFLGLRAASRHLADGGSVVNTSSALAMVGFPMLISYISSKWAIRGMTRVAALELAGRGIRVNAVLPSIVETALISDWDDQRREFFKSLTPLGRFSDPAEIAKMSLFLLSDASGMCTGSDFVIDGGFTAH
jgi:3alpha(or 20beta)-hydroxysteroid dehydrogenase